MLLWTTGTGALGCADPCPRLSPGGVGPVEHRPDGRYFVATSDSDGACPLDRRLDLGERVGGAWDRRVTATWPTATDPVQTGWSDVAPGEHPVVVFSHAANADTCTLHNRYSRLHSRWASQGWIVVSVAAGGSLCGSMSAENLEQRAALVELARSALPGLDRGLGDLGPFMAGHLDSGRVVFAGHSRGGGASLLAAAWAAEEDRPPLGVVALQPVDPMAWVVPLGTVAVPTLLVLAENDADVVAAHTASLDAAFGAAWGTVEVPGGIHAWTADDLPPRADADPETSADAQRLLTDEVSAQAFVELDGEGTLAPWAWTDDIALWSDIPLRMRWGGRPDAVVLADFQDGAQILDCTDLEVCAVGVPFDSDDPERHDRAKWAHLVAENDGAVTILVPVDALGAERVELVVLGTPDVELVLEHGQSTALRVLPPSSASLMDPQRGVMMGADIPGGLAGDLVLRVQGDVWIDNVVAFKVPD